MNLEDLLQQYGEDQRQQAQAAARVRGMARRAAWWRTGVACALVLGVTVIVALRHTSAPRLQAPMVAEAGSVGINGAPDNEAISSTSRLSGISRLSRMISEPMVTLEAAAAADTTSLFEAAAAPIPEETPVEVPAVTADLPILVKPDFSALDLAMSEPPSSQVERPSRLRFTAGIGVSYGGSTDLGLTAADIHGSGFNNIDGMTEGTSMHITPQGALMARVGMLYTMAQTEKHHLDVGIGLDGYTMQNEVTETIVTPELSGADDTPIDYRTYNASVQSLYLNLPLVWDSHRRGADRMGWQYSLTPAHRIVSSQQIGTKALNPWKLNLGFGISLPRGGVRSVSLTANLLPTYQYHEMHEFGIVVGF